MPNKTIYLRTEDVKLLEKLSSRAKLSASALITELLRRETRQQVFYDSIDSGKSGKSVDNVGANGRKS